MGGPLHPQPRQENTMIVATNEKAPYRTAFSNGKHIFYTDVPLEKGGSDSSFRPHELLEAALACCMNITVRMSAEKLGIPASKVTVRVSLNRDDPARSLFEYALSVEGDISPEQRQTLEAAVAACPVHATLKKEISFSCIP
jgi:putative redox protein